MIHENSQRGFNWPGERRCEAAGEGAGGNREQRLNLIQKLDKLLFAQTGIVQDLHQDSPAQFFSRVDRDNSRSSVRMLHEKVTAPLP